MSNRLPAGFTLDEPETSVDLPEGFVLDEMPEAVAELPLGFSLDPVSAPITVDPANPAGTGVGRAIDRGLLRLQAAPPTLAAMKDATILNDAALSEQELIRQVFLETTRLPEVPDGVDISTPELASAVIADAGYPAQFANIFRQTYDLRKRDAQQGAEDPETVLERGTNNQLAAQDLHDQASEIPFSPAGSSFREKLSEAPDTVSDVLKVYLQNPGEAAAFLGETAAESLPQMGAAGVTTLATRSPAAGAAVLGGGSLVQEYSAGVNEFFQEKGVQVQSPEDAVTLLRNPEFMAEASRRGLGRGTVIALFEMAGQGAAAKSLFKSATADAAKDVTTQAATGAGGEATARLATGQELSAKEIITEGLAEGVAAPVEVGPAAIEDARRVRAADVSESSNSVEPVVVTGPDLDPDTSPLPADVDDVDNLTPDTQELKLEEPTGVEDDGELNTGDVADRGDDSVLLGSDNVDDETASQEAEEDRDPTGRVNPQQNPNSYADLGDAPAMKDAATTERGSHYEQAYRDAGLDPDEAVVLPAAQKVNVLSQVTQDKFGITVERGKGRLRGKANDAVDNLQDGYRNLQFMAHTLGLSNEALSLGGRLKLSLDGKSRSYLGLYNGDTHTIHMPGRSNSFAHEWMHAADHYLLDQLRPGAERHLLSQETRKSGLDPSEGLDAAFINVVNNLFFDEADIAVQMMRLEKEASRTRNGAPTKAALKAQKSLEHMAAGATRVRVKPSAFREKSKSHAPSKADYFGSVHEMLARAFEAYIAQKVEAAGGTTEFIAKGDEAYLNDADQALANLYPKTSERKKIFAAFDELFAQMATEGTLGGPSEAADKPADVDILDPAYWSKRGLLTDTTNTSAVRSELRRVRNGLKNLVNRPLKSSLKDGGSVLANNAGVAAKTDENSKGYVGRVAQRMGDVARYYLFSLRGFVKAHVSREPADAQLFLNELLDRVMTDHGSGKAVEETFEEARERVTNRAGADIKNMLHSHKLENWVTGGLRDSDNDAIRELLLGKTVQGATKAQKSIAAGLRRIMDASYRRAVNAGIEMGYVEDTGYVPRTLLPARVNDDPKQFTDDATKVYEIMFDQITSDIDPEDLAELARGVSRRVAPMEKPANGPFALKLKALKEAADATPQNAQALQNAKDDLIAAIRDGYATSAAEDWKDRIIAGDSMSFDSLGPDANFSKARKLPPEADTLLAEWYETDVLVSVLSYVHGTEARAQYHQRFGKPGGYDKIDRILSRPEVKNAVETQPKKYNPKTSRGRLNILKDLADVRRDNLKEMAANEAAALGAHTDSIGAVRHAIEEITGRSQDRGVRHSDRLSAAVFMLGHIILLPRAAWSSVVEPLTVLMRTGDTATAAKTFGLYLREAVRGNKDVKELAAIAEMIGLVSTPLHDTVLLNRMSGDHGNVVSGNTILTRFFRANFLSQLTNAQRRAVLAGGTYWLRDLAKQYRKADLDAGHKKIIQREFAELGIKETDLDHFAGWLADGDGLPSLDELQTAEGQVFQTAMTRFTDQTIQNPRRADKPMLASSSFGRLAYALMSFSYTFFANVHVAAAKRSSGNYKTERDTGAGKGRALSSASLPVLTTAAGFATLYAGQFVVSMAREALYNQDTWEEKEENDEWAEWMGRLALSRTGVFGPADALFNAYTGLRYERDLTSLMVGATPAYFASNIQNILKGLPGGPRNSAHTNTAEHTAAKSLYRITAVPLTNILLSAVPAPGGGSAFARYGAMQYLSSNTAAGKFADTVAGEKGSRTD